MNYYIIGVVGMCLIILGWVISMKRAPPLKLSLCYGTGALLLAAYAYLINDILFLFLNSMAAILSFINAIRAVKGVNKCEN